MYVQNVLLTAETRDEASHFKPKAKLGKIGKYN